MSALAQMGARRGKDERDEERKEGRGRGKDGRFSLERGGFGYEHHLHILLLEIQTY